MYGLLPSGRATQFALLWVPTRLRRSLLSGGQLCLGALVCCASIRIIQYIRTHSFPAASPFASEFPLNTDKYFVPDQQIVVVEKCSMNANAIQSVRLYETACNCNSSLRLFLRFFRTVLRPRLDPVWPHLADENSFRSAHCSRAALIEAWC